MHSLKCKHDIDVAILSISLPFTKRYCAKMAKHMIEILISFKTSIINNSVARKQSPTKVGDVTP